jgi:DNA-directed RNA polymerase specialized sigma24 family protein
MRDHESNPDVFEAPVAEPAAAHALEGLRHAARTATRRPVTAASALALRVLSERSRAVRRAGESSGDDAESRIHHDLERVTVALRELRRLRPVQAEVLSMHTLAGLSMEEVAATLGVSEQAAERELRDARLWMGKNLPD